MEYDDILAVWYHHATKDHANPMCVSFKHERDAIKERTFFNMIATRLGNRDSWYVTPDTLTEDNPITNEKKGDVRYYVHVQHND